MVELEEIANQGFNVIFRSRMPKRLKRLELKLRPAFYYSVGDLNILNSDHTLGVVGARDAKQEELAQVYEVCKQAAYHNIVVISGGAAGVDSTATKAALENGGRAVIFPSVGIGSLIKNKATRNYIQNGQLLILSTQPIHATFTGKYAMERNKFIHSTGDAVLIGASQISGTKRSGTWEGVLENIRAQWSPLYTVGHSIGVLELLKTNKAQAFTSLNDIYPLHEQLCGIFNQRLQSVMDEGINAGLSMETIVELLQKKIDNFKEIQHPSVNNKEKLTLDSVKSTDTDKLITVKDELDNHYLHDKEVGSIRDTLNIADKDHNNENAVQTSKDKSNIKKEKKVSNEQIELEIE